ncbi:hypothetical protein G6F35_002476 [Rhizopus arrhizus]|nr:hypothetical protein G6F35_002476 [Rhizopus arrhizus]
MTAALDVKLVLKDCTDYTVKHSIGIITKRAARVVSVASLKHFLLAKYSSHYLHFISFYKTLENFLRIEARTFSQYIACGEWHEWNYELIMVEDYLNDSRYLYRYFPELVEQKSSNTLLFVCFSEENNLAYFQDINTNKQPKLRPKQSMIDERRSLKNRIQAKLHQVWPHLGLSIAVFGSSANELALKDADLDLCIVVPEAVYEQDLRKYKHQLNQLHGTVYNMQDIANMLIDMGMKKVEPICSATVPICKFMDPVTQLHCDINTNNVLGIENTKLIHQYIKMDTRVAPFLFAIKHFIKQKDINNTTGGTLSSYAYIIMALHFLMVHYIGPVIPSLQNLSVPCVYKKCNWKAARPSLVFHDKRIMECATRFHDCVAIENLITNEFTPPKSSTSTTPTVWKSSNFFLVGSLLIDFFHYYSQPENLRVSIISGEKMLTSYPLKSRDRDIIIQDPFLITKNVAKTCSSIGLDIIMKEFTRAAELLEEGYSFEYVCDQSLNLPRPIDKRTIDYKRKLSNGHRKKRGNARRMENIHLLVAAADELKPTANDSIQVNITNETSDVQGLARLFSSDNENQLESIPSLSTVPSNSLPLPIIKEDKHSITDHVLVIPHEEDHPPLKETISFRLPESKTSMTATTAINSDPMTTTTSTFNQRKSVKKAQNRATENLKQVKQSEKEKALLNPTTDEEKSKNKMVTKLVKKLLAVKDVRDINALDIIQEIGITKDIVPNIMYVVSQLLSVKRCLVENAELYGQGEKEYDGEWYEDRKVGEEDGEEDGDDEEKKRCVEYTFQALFKQADDSVEQLSIEQTVPKLEHITIPKVKKAVSKTEHGVLKKKHDMTFKVFQPGKTQGDKPNKEEDPMQECYIGYCTVVDSSEEKQHVNKAVKQEDEEGYEQTKPLKFNKQPSQAMHNNQYEERIGIQLYVLNVPPEVKC